MAATGPQEDELVTFGPFIKGVNNRLKDHELSHQHLRQAVNVHLSDVGRISRRPGFVLKHATTADCHSLYTAHTAGMVAVDGETLFLYNPLTSMVAQLRTGMHPRRLVGYVTLPGGDVYYSDGVVTGKIVGGINKPWGIRPPSGVPTLASTTGALSAGRYRVFLTYVTAAGEESGAGLPGVFTLAAPGGLAISGIPTTGPADVAFVAVYVSPADGEMAYLTGMYPLGVSTVDYLTETNHGITLKSQHILPPPAGNVLAYTNGRIYIANGSTVWYTEPLQYGRCLHAKNFMQFPADVTVMAGVRDGLYVVSDQTYFLSGTDPATMESNVVLQFGGAFGTLTTLSDANTWAWFSDHGMVKASSGGQVVELQTGQVFVDAADVGASLFIEELGQQQLYSVTHPKSFGSAATAQGFVEMEVRRKGE